MSFDPNAADEHINQKKIERLQSYHQRHQVITLTGLLIGVVCFVLWASNFKIDEIAKASGEVIASSRVQVIQAVDGGVISELLVQEGDMVRPGQMLARLDQTRVGASVGEVEVRLVALQAKALRLRAEVTGKESIQFPEDMLKTSVDVIKIERALFEQRQIGLSEDIKNLKVAIELSRKELGLIQKLYDGGDASGTELLRAKKALNDAKSKLASLENKFLEDARQELNKTEDEISQNEQILTKRKQEQADSVFRSTVRGIVKNVRITTVGGVLRAGEELMQIIPIDDDLIVEVKVSPADIGKVRKELSANIKFDPFDYTLYGSVKGEVIYVSADTLKEDTNQGQEIYYRVHVKPVTYPVVTSTGKALEVLPGMTAQVDIRTGERTLMNYLLKPLRRTVSESFGER